MQRYSHNCSCSINHCIHVHSQTTLPTTFYCSSWCCCMRNSGSRANANDMIGKCQYPHANRWVLSSLGSWEFLRHFTLDSDFLSFPQFCFSYHNIHLLMPTRFLSAWDIVRILCCNSRVPLRWTLIVGMLNWKSFLLPLMKLVDRNMTILQA